MNTLARWLLLFILACAVGAFSSLLKPYHLFVVGGIAVAIIVTLGLGLLVGVVGLLSLASPAFLGFGAYGAIYLVSTHNVPLLLAVCVLVLIAWLLGYVLGLISLRLAGFHLAIVTLGVTSAFLVFLKTGGPIVGNGYGLIASTPTIPFLGVLTPDLASQCAIGLTVLIAAAVYGLTHSRMGRAWYAVKNDETAAATLGIDVAKTKAAAFATSSAIIALGGTLQGFILGATSPSSYDQLVAVSHVAFVVIAGGTGSIAGAFVAPFCLLLIPEAFPKLGHWREVFFGSVLLAALAISPASFARRFHLRRFHPLDLLYRLRRPFTAILVGREK